MTDDSELRKTMSLVRAAQSGDTTSRDELLARYYPIVLRIVALRMHKRSRDPDLEDLVQESLTDAFQGLQGFEQRGEGDFRNWLARIVENNVKDFLRRKKAIKRGPDQVKLCADMSSTSLSESLF